MSDPDLNELEREPNTPGELIRAVREFHGLEQEAMAHLFRVSRRTIIRWEQRGHFFFLDDDDRWGDFRSRYWRQLHEKYQQALNLRCNTDGVLKFLEAAPEGAARGVTSKGDSHAKTKKGSSRPARTAAGRGADRPAAAVRATPGPRGQRARAKRVSGRVPTQR